MDWKEAESLFLEIRDCFLICEDILSPMSSRRALELRQEIARHIRKLSEILARGEKYWKTHDSVEQRDQGKPRLIPKDHLEKVCRLGQGAATCCLVVAGRRGFQCMKGTNLEPILKQRAVAGEMTARRVNCGGPPEELPQAGNAVVLLYCCPRCGGAGLPSTWAEHNCCTACANHLRLGHPDPKTETQNAVPEVGQERPAQEGRDVEDQATLQDGGQGQGGHPPAAGEGA